MGYRLPTRDSQFSKEQRALLLSVGLLRESGHEHFNGLIVVPTMNEEGIISEVYGRKALGKRLRKGTAIHTCLPGPHQGVWNVEGIKNCTEVVTGKVVTGDTHHSRIREFYYQSGSLYLII
ncbi:hypothetical protein [Pleionea litopenaei]|uniref:Uncharacterized protein n=1 Tax=Pleionea litopenaei TaxID=3070815 RepID=A0AA51RUA1_9GAMM|nr:hypothetical protein [Pleionea sp. HL-JVS1]WMS87613.1 hypothetical protein Q9312_01500 [Pleionea sp. HL-JVS1]